MVQANRGLKRHCGQCGANYYDLNRTPIVCPKCNAEYVPLQRLPTRGGSRAAARVVEPVVVDEVEEVDAFVEDEVLGSDVDEEEVLPADEDEDEEPELRE
jgi:uncharacterized protein (TIGR02300 family)